MTVRALSWLGIVTSDLERDRDFLSGALGLARGLQTDTFVLLTADNGDVIELFRDTDPGHAHFTAGPVPGLQVDDLDAAAAAVRAAGAELIGDVCAGSLGTRWIHFRAPDGTVFELIEKPGGEPAAPSGKAT